MIDLAGKTGLRELCYVLKKASLFVGVDSGIMHLASVWISRLWEFWTDRPVLRRAPRTQRAGWSERKNWSVSRATSKGAREGSA